MLYCLKVAMIFGARADAVAAWGALAALWPTSSRLPEDSVPTLCPTFEGTFKVVGIVRQPESIVHDKILLALRTAGVKAKGWQVKVHECPHADSSARPCEETIYSGGTLLGVEDA